MRMGYLQVVEEEEHIAGKFLLGNSETIGHRGCLANGLGVFLTNSRVKILKVIKPRLLTLR